MTATFVSLSSGDTFYIDAPPSRVANKLQVARATGPRAGTMLKIGDRWVNPGQVAQLVPTREIPSIHVPERLED